MRLEENYVDLINVNDVKLSGIAEDCVFNQLQSFHATKHRSIYVMHDIVEGICRRDVALILDDFINKKHYFTLGDLNQRVRGFYFGNEEHVNRPPEIIDTQIKNHNVTVSASEMYQLVTHLNIIIGDFVREGDGSWSLLLQFQRIIEIVYSSAVTNETSIVLRMIIAQYLDIHEALFPKKLIPKHLLVHYPRIMREVGPLSKVSSIRFEAVHQVGKKCSRVSTSRVNVCKTIAIKHQLILN